TYMYLFGKGDAAKPFMGCGHAAEIPYVFNSKLAIGEGNAVDPVLAETISSMWINFAKTGNPSVEGFEWSEYTLEDRATMVVGNDCSLSMVNDPKGEQRAALMPLIDELF
ncbi:MAG: carboxylesterase family protein, partial [Methanocorpusculum sp.]|nr:carboxylesterase family protein [Methanocorpusculum sp.]